LAQILTVSIVMAGSWRGPARFGTTHGMTKFREAVQFIAGDLYFEEPAVQ